MDEGSDFEVVVVGAGIIGAWVAYTLAREGRRVAVIDPHPGGGASRGNAGMLVPSYCLPMSNPAVLWSGVRTLLRTDGTVSLARPLSMATLGWLAHFAWQSRPGRASRDASQLYTMAQRSSDSYADFAHSEGFEIGLRHSGWLHAVRDRKLLHREARVAEKLGRLGVRSQVLSRGEARTLEPGLSDEISGAVFFPDDAALDPAETTDAVLTAASRHGALILTDEVVDTATDLRGGVTVTTTARRIRTRVVVLAAGTLTSSLAERCGIKIPRIEPGYGWSVVLPTPEALTATSLISADDHVVINAGPASVRITGGMRFGADPHISYARSSDFLDLRAAAQRLVPKIAEIEATGHLWSGARPMTASGLPVVRAFGPNHIIAAGHGTLGMTLAPETAAAVARELNELSARSVT